MANKTWSSVQKGTYAGGTAYIIGDFVVYGGSSYTCIANTTGNLPTNPTYWALVVSKGDTGATGATGSTGPTGATGATGATGSAEAATTIELGHASDTTISRVSGGVIAVEGVTIPTVSSFNTFTNKRITKRTGTTTSSATPTINTDNVDEYYITAQAEAITSMTTNLSGTPTLGQLLFIHIIGTAARGITWGASFANGPVALPTTTVTTTALSTLLKWDGAIWRCYATGSTV